MIPGRRSLGVAKTVAAALLATAGWNCAPRAQVAAPDGVAQAPRAATTARAWERAVEGGGMENKGVARIEKIGERWALSVLCEGTHSTYLDTDATTVEPEDYAGGHVVARYGYVDHVRTDIKCIRAPCGPVTERRIALDEVKKVGVTPAQALEFTSSCSAR